MKNPPPTHPVTRTIQIFQQAKPLSFPCEIYEIAIQMRTGTAEQLLHKIFIRPAIRVESWRPGRQRKRHLGGIWQSRLPRHTQNPAGACSSLGELTLDSPQDGKGCTVTLLVSVGTVAGVQVWDDEVKEVCEKLSPFHTSSQYVRKLPWVLTG